MGVVTASCALLRGSPPRTAIVSIRPAIAGVLPAHREAKRRFRLPDGGAATQRLRVIFVRRVTQGGRKSRAARGASAPDRFPLRQPVRVLSTARLTATSV